VSLALEVLSSCWLPHAPQDCVDSRLSDQWFGCASCCLPACLPAWLTPCVACCLPQALEPLEGMLAGLDVRDDVAVLLDQVSQ
jgi:hypothetical protein